MSKSFSERRLTENQAVFRKINEKVPKKLSALKKAAVKEGHGPLVRDINVPLHFYCECSDENCRERIVLKPSEYNQLHKNSSQFIVLPGHEVLEIERPVVKNNKFVVVEKFKKPPKGATQLHPTELDHS